MLTLYWDVTEQFLVAQIIISYVPFWCVDR